MAPNEHEHGAAILMALLASMLLAGLGMGLMVLGDVESRIATNFETAMETFYAADAGIHLATADLKSIARWSDALSGVAQSTFRDSTRQPQLATRQTIDLDAITAELQAESNSASPWGSDNPVWRLFAWGALASAGGSGIASRCYIAVWIADDGADGDANPMTDTNRVLRLHAEAYASAETRRVIEATVAQTAGFVRMLAWREVR